MAKKPKRRRIVGGVDTHSGTHHAAVVLMNGRRLADAEFPATAAGYGALLEWMHSFGRLHAVGVEGTGSYGAALARHLHNQQVKVVEVNRPDRRQRRTMGKSDPLDAYAAAGAVLADRANAVPKAGDGIVESIRALHTARAGAVKARTACMNELQALLVTAPADLREELTGRKGAKLAAACAQLTSTSGRADLADPTSGTRYALACLARRWHNLSTEITDLDDRLATLVQQARPDLLAVRGVGTETAAQLLSTCGDNPDRLRSEAAFAALCGVAPIPASSGKTTRHRLNRGGDRQANRALHTIAIVRMSHDPRTRRYVERRTRQGLSTKEIIRCLKRYIARELFKLLTCPKTPNPPSKQSSRSRLTRHRSINPGAGRGDPRLRSALLTSFQVAQESADLPGAVVALPVARRDSMFIPSRQVSAPVNAPPECTKWTAGMWSAVLDDHNARGVQLAVTRLNAPPPDPRRGSYEPGGSLTFSEAIVTGPAPILARLGDPRPPTACAKQLPDLTGDHAAIEPMRIAGLGTRSWAYRITGTGDIPVWQWVAIVQTPRYVLELRIPNQGPPPRPEPADLLPQLAAAAYARAQVSLSP